MVAFNLIPFIESKHRDQLKIQGEWKDLFSPLTLNLQGNFSYINWPKLHSGRMFTPTPEMRRDQLWQQTCVELFLRPENSPLYWEFHFTPEGYWNFFSFTEYRQGMTPVYLPQYFSWSFTLNKSQELTFSLQLNLSPDFWSVHEGTWFFHPTIVLADTQNEKSYWAWGHPAQAPDFHLPLLHQLKVYR